MYSEHLVNFVSIAQFGKHNNAIIRTKQSNTILCECKRIDLFVLGTTGEKMF